MAKHIRREPAEQTSQTAGMHAAEPQTADTQAPSCVIEVPSADAQTVSAQTAASHAAAQTTDTQAASTQTSTSHAAVTQPTGAHAAAQTTSAQTTISYAAVTQPTGAQAAVTQPTGAQAAIPNDETPSAPSITAPTYVDPWVASLDENSPRMKKSRRVRKRLIVLIVVLLLLMGGVGYIGWTMFQESHQQAAKQASSEGEVLESDTAQDASNDASKVTDAPDLYALIGMTQEEAIETLAHGAEVAKQREVSEEGNPVVLYLTVSLTEEPEDARLGVPVVYLGLNEDGIVVSTGYSVGVALLGLGSMSFADAISNENIVEETLIEAGVPVAAGSALLPEDSQEYSVYSSDGETLVQEKCSFSGVVELDGTEYDWSAVIIYDYKLANKSGVLTDTIRQIYIYLETPGADVLEDTEE